MLRIFTYEERHILYPGCEAFDSDGDGETRAIPANEYARCEDFRKLFLDNMDSLYQLCLLLTSDSSRAEQCFINALDDCAKSEQVLKEWALPWAKRRLIQNVIRVLQPHPGRTESSQALSNFTLQNPIEGQEWSSNLAAVLSLQPFERTVFVLSALEGYSDRDCASLLDCSMEEIFDARARALLQFASSYHLDSSIATGSTETVDSRSCNSAAK